VKLIVLKVNDFHDYSKKDAKKIQNVKIGLNYKVNPDAILVVCRRMRTVKKWGWGKQNDR